MKPIGKGLHAWRTAREGDEEERRFAKAWIDENSKSHRLLDYLLGEGVTPVDSGERDVEVAATVVQWLGSPVGRNFLEQLGYVRRN